MEYKYKAFISYKHVDKEWARRIADRLRADQFSCFFDADSLRAGEGWDKQILQSLIESEHLVVLVSKHIDGSLEWVNEEVNRFRTQNGALPEGTGRKIIPVLLDAEAKGMGSVQSINVLKDANAYEQGPSTIANSLWTELISRIESALLFDANTIPVCLAVMALNRGRFVNLYDANTELFADKIKDSLNATRRTLNSATDVEKLKDCYGASPYDWKPFGGSVPIKQIFADVKAVITPQIPDGGRGFEWVYLDELFYYPNETDIALAQLTKMKTGLAVFVIDPLSLHDNDMIVRLGLLDQYFDDDKSAILVFASEIAEQHSDLLRLVQRRATRFFQHFYESKVRRQYAHFGCHICDEREIRLMLRTTLGPYVSTDPSQPGSPFITTGVPMIRRP